QLLTGQEFDDDLRFMIPERIRGIARPACQLVVDFIVLDLGIGPAGEGLACVRPMMSRCQCVGSQAQEEERNNRCGPFWTPDGLPSGWRHTMGQDHSVPGRSKTATIGAIESSSRCNSTQRMTLLGRIGS